MEGDERVREQNQTKRKKGIRLADDGLLSTFLVREKIKSKEAS